MRIPTVLRRAPRLATGGTRAVRDGRTAIWKGLARRRLDGGRFRLLAENERDVIYRYRFVPKPGFDYVSPSSTAVTGYTPEEHYADPGLRLELVHPEDRHLLEASTRDPAGPLVLRWRRKDGVPIRIEQRDKPVYDRAGRLIAVEGIARDVTAFKRVEDALRESEALAHFTIDSLSANIAILDSSGGIVAVNRAWTDFAGDVAGTDDRGAGANYLRVCDSATGRGCREAALFAGGIRGVISGRETYFEMEYPCHTPAGRRWFVGRVTPFPGVGEPRVVVAHENTTERKLAEEALRHSEEGFRLLAENTNDLVCLHEPDGCFLYLSPSCRRLLDYEPGDLIGTDPYALVHPEDLERIRRNSHDRVLRKQAVSTTYRIRKASGDYTWFETLIQPILDRKGAMIQLQTSSRDVGDRKRAERALADVTGAKTEFLAEVSHELRTPLTVIRGNAEVGLDLDPGREHGEILAEIVKESSTMARMVEELLFLARSESAAPPFRMEPVAVKTLLVGLAKRAASVAAGHGATLAVSASGDGLVRADPARVEQAVLALVDNAGKYGPEGQNITLESVASSGELRVEVKDRGLGIPTADLPHVFERFYRGPDTVEPGNDLGLAIARTIAEAHGGRVEVGSEPGRGTQVSVVLPLLPASK